MTIFEWLLVLLPLILLLVGFMHIVIGLLSKLRRRFLVRGLAILAGGVVLGLFTYSEYGLGNKLDLAGLNRSRFNVNLGPESRRFQCLENAFHQKRSSNT